MNKIFRFVLLTLTIPFFQVSNAFAAAPSVDTFNIQSLLRLSNNTAVSATSANFVFAVFKGSNCVWAKRYSSVAINNGVINQKISGTGTNVSSINNASANAGECVANYSGVTLNSTLLNTGSAAALTIRVYTETSIDSYKPIWDIPLNSAPTAFIADVANSAVSASSADDLSSSRKVTTSTGAADSGKIPALGTNGTIDNSMINSSALTIASTQVSGLGTAATVNTGTTSGTIPLLGTGGRLAAARLPTYSANKIMATDGSGVMNTAYDTITTSTGSGDSGKIPLLNGSGKLDSSVVDSSTVEADPSNFTASVPVNKGGTGVATITTNALMVGAGTGNVTSISPSTSGNVLSSNGTTWASQTRDSAGLVDKVNTQTGIAGNKTWTGNQTVTGTLKVGDDGTAINDFIKCPVYNVTSDTLTANGLTTIAVSCTGVTATSSVSCSFTSALPYTNTTNYSLLQSTYSATNTINLVFFTRGITAAWTTSINCTAVN